MTLIDEVLSICERLGSQGWKQLLLKHGLDISASNLKEELQKELTNIDRSLPGFEDFSLEGKRGIEPGNPSRSLLFHAFASPNVIGDSNENIISKFPTLTDIETIENYVYGSNPLSILDLKARADGRNLAICVFASEYRPAPETVHKKHADMCYSRTGVSRIGTKSALYDPKIRGFLPFVDNDPHNIRVLPSKYSVFVAVQMKGSKDIFGPMRFDAHLEDDFVDTLVSDKQLDFWVPIYKLFSGKECIVGLDLDVKLICNHINEKIRRIHEKLNKSNFVTGWREPDISNPPFIFSEGIAEFSNDESLGSGLLVPVAHNRLVEEAKYQGKLLSFRLPSNNRTLSSSLYIPGSGGGIGPRHAPEYVHVRTKIENGSLVDLNNELEVSNIVAEGDYDALHYVDHTGDGWVKAECPQVKILTDRYVPAYSLVTAPDFFPNTDQRELMETFKVAVPSDLKDRLWVVTPFALCDQRLPPNLQLKNVDFRKEDNTVTAIVSMPLKGPVGQVNLHIPLTNRHAYLPDAASSVFAPGWDVSFDDIRLGGNSSGIKHLAAYGLGSPFPEDSKLCAALSTFWPAVAPDAARTFQPNFSWPTVSPLTDTEIGIEGDLPWDGIAGPHYVPDDNEVEYPEFDHADYTLNALNNKFSLSLTGKVDVVEYQTRVVSMARVYRVLGSRSEEERASWGIISFKQIFQQDSELDSVDDTIRNSLTSPIYRFEVYQHGTRKLSPDNDPKKIRVSIKGKRRILIVSPSTILMKIGDGEWEVKNE